MVLTQPFCNRNLPYSLSALRPSVLIEHKAYQRHPGYVRLNVPRFLSELVIETIPNTPYWLILVWPSILTRLILSRGLDISPCAGGTNPIYTIRALLPRLVASPITVFITILL